MSTIKVHLNGKLHDPAIIEESISSLIFEYFEDSKFITIWDVTDPILSDGLIVIVECNKDIEVVPNIHESLNQALIHHQCQICHLFLVMQGDLVTHAVDGRNIPQRYQSLWKLKQKEMEIQTHCTFTTFQNRDRCTEGCSLCFSDASSKDSLSGNLESSHRMGHKGTDAHKDIPGNYLPPEQ